MHPSDSPAPEVEQDSTAAEGWTGAAIVLFLVIATVG
jgi:hypothetical protein